MVRAFQSFASEKQLQRLTGKFEIRSAKDYAPLPGEADYQKKNDVPWLKRFAADGGKVVISGDTAMKNVPHERMALIELGFVVIFFESQWSNWKFFRKCALLLHWWPEVARKIIKPKPGFWHIPCTWAENGKLRKVSTEDPKRLKFEKPKRAEKRPKRKAAPRAETVVKPSQFEFEFGKAESSNDRQPAPAAEKR